MRLIVAKTILRSLQHLYFQQGRGIILSKTILIRVLLEANHKLVQQITKGSNAYAHKYTPTPPLASCCTVR